MIFWAHTLHPGMTQSKPAPRQYRQHRERQRQRILNAARMLFDERGIDRTTMADIITATGIRASTLYQYFANKEEVVWAIVRHLMAGAMNRMSSAMDAQPTALARITAMLELMADELAHDSAAVRYLAQFDAMYARDWTAERMLALEAEISAAAGRRFSDLIRAGIADGSLRPDLDPELTLHAVVNTVIGAQRRLAALGSLVEREYGQPVDRLFREGLRILLLGLRAG